MCVQVHNVCVKVYNVILFPTFTMFRFTKFTGVPNMNRFPLQSAPSPRFKRKPLPPPRFGYSPTNSYPAPSPRPAYSLGQNRPNQRRGSDSKVKY